MYNLQLLLPHGRHHGHHDYPGRHGYGGHGSQGADLKFVATSSVKFLSPV